MSGGRRERGCRRVDGRRRGHGDRRRGHGDRRLRRSDGRRRRNHHGGRFGHDGRGGRRRLGCGLLGGRSRRGGEGLAQPAGDGGFDGRGRALHELAHLAQFGEEILAGDAELFRKLVNAGLAGHLTPFSKTGGIPHGPLRRWTYSLLALHRELIARQLLRFCR
jgi:hypothetical protein